MDIQTTFMKRAVFSVFINSAEAVGTDLSGPVCPPAPRPGKSRHSVCDGEKFTCKGHGSGQQGLQACRRLEKLAGTIAIGHNRYSTTGSSDMTNAQPILINCSAGHIAGAHNGNLTNTQRAARRMENDGSIFLSTTDTEVIMHLIARSKARIHRHDDPRRVIAVQGAYSILFLTKDALYGARDPHGFGRLSWVNWATRISFRRKPAPSIWSARHGPRNRARGNGAHRQRRRHQFFHSRFRAERRTRSYCVFEYIYFSRPD